MPGLVGRFTEMFRKAASKLIKVDPGLRQPGKQPELSEWHRRGEAMVILKFRVKVDTVEGPVDLGLPLPAFSPVRDIFDPAQEVELRTATS